VGIQAMPLFKFRSVKKIFHPLDYRRHSVSIKNTEICRNRFLVVRKLGLMLQQIFQKNKNYETAQIFFGIGTRPYFRTILS